MGLIFCFVIQTRETLTLFTQTQHKPKGINPNPTFANNFTNPPLLWDRLALDRPLHPPFHFTHLTFRSEGEQIRGKSLRVLFYFESCHCWQNKNKVTRFFGFRWWSIVWMKFGHFFLRIRYKAIQKTLNGQWGRNGFYLGEDRKFLILYRGGSEPIFPNVILVFPKRGGSILRSSPVPLSQKMVKCCRKMCNKY